MLYGVMNLGGQALFLTKITYWLDKTPTLDEKYRS
ncbi:hypothetical protein SAMN04488601_101838 [Paenibacillus sp. 453mf]|nr:hypothetical protein SAMN04488601_101838 [Paenibacillus sp. 453mf]